MSNMSKKKNEMKIKRKRMTSDEKLAVEAAWFAAGNVPACLCFALPDKKRRMLCTTQRKKTVR